VAIVVSSRLLRIDDWSKIGGWYFDRLFEAYNACLYAHRPASFVFAEDATPEVLKKYRAVLVVGQRVELDPPLAAALKAARAGGISVFHDGTCRPNVVKDFTPLGIAFDKLLKEPSAWQDDSAYARFPVYFTEQAAVLGKALGSAVPPVAGCGEPGVMLTERRSGDARFVWAVNNVPTGLDPGLAWRVGLLISQRAPLVTKLALDADGKAVYDVFALRPVAGNEVEADLRTMPARLYAILPAPIGRVIVRAPSAVPAGRAFAWEAALVDPRGQPLRASLPVRVRLIGSDGSILTEEYTATGGEGARGRFVLPLNAPPGPALIEVVDLIAGKSALLGLKVQLQDHPAPLSPSDARPEEAPIPAGATADGTGASDLAPAEAAFGPHFRSVAASADGSTVLLGAFNWDQNLYALDARTGEVRWRGRVGHHFAYAPAAAGGGFTAQGFDLSTAEGYHLYRVAADGRPERRYALFGLPKRATNWAAGAHLLDPIDHFAAAADGSWVASSGDLGLAVWDPGRQAPLGPRLVEDGAEAAAAAGDRRRHPAGPGRRPCDRVPGSVGRAIVDGYPGEIRGAPGRGGQRGRAHDRPARQRRGRPRLRPAGRQGRERPPRRRRRGRPLAQRLGRGRDRREAAPVVLRRGGAGVGFHRGRRPPRPGGVPGRAAGVCRE
jgi:hypothetical protein